MLLLDTLLIDTGSSNTWVGAGKAYAKTKTSMQTSNNVVSIISLLDRWCSTKYLCELYPLVCNIRLWVILW